MVIAPTSAHDNRSKGDGFNIRVTHQTSFEYTYRAREPYTAIFLSQGSKHAHCTSSRHNPIDPYKEPTAPKSESQQAFQLHDAIAQYEGLLAEQPHHPTKNQTQYAVSLQGAEDQNLKREIADISHAPDLRKYLRAKYAEYSSWLNRHRLIYHSSLIRVVTHFNVTRNWKIFFGMDDQ